MVHETPFLTQVLCLRRGVLPEPVQREMPALDKLIFRGGEVCDAIIDPA